MCTHSSGWMIRRSVKSWCRRDGLGQANSRVTRRRELLSELAKGRKQRYPVAWVDMRRGGRREQPAIGVFAPAVSEPTRGSVTLEEYLLGFDPLHHRLIPVSGLAKYAA